MTSMWDGAPLTLAQNEQAIMPQTPNGSAVLAWLNMATQNNSGTLALTTDGTAPQMLEAPALMTAPNIVSQMKRMTASSSDQISGRLKT